MASTAVNINDVWDWVVKGIDQGLPVFAQLLYYGVSNLILVMFLSLTKLIIRVILIRDLDDTSVAVVTLVR
jgi:hypothetical protein